MGFGRLSRRTLYVSAFACGLIAVLIEFSPGQENGGSECYTTPPGTTGTCNSQANLMCDAQGGGECSYCDGTATLPNSYCVSAAVQWGCNTTGQQGVDCGTQFVGNCATGSDGKTYVCQKTDELGEADGCSNALTTPCAGSSPPPPAK